MSYAWAAWIVDDTKLAYLLAKGPQELKNSLVLSCGVGETQWEGLGWFEDEGCLIITSIEVKGKIYTRLEVQVPCPELAKEVEAWLSPEWLDGPGDCYNLDGTLTKGETYDWGILKTIAA